MPKFRKEIKSNFTTVHNAFIEDLHLENGSIGLLLKMLKLPDNWNFSIKGLAAISKDGERRIARQLKELEEFGYVVRHRVYIEGRIADWEYIISDEALPEEILLLGRTNLSRNNADTSEKLHLQNVDVDIEDVQTVGDYKIKNNKVKKDKIYSTCQSSHNLKLTQEYENHSQIDNNRTDMTDKTEPDSNFKPSAHCKAPEILSREKLKAQICYDRLIRQKPGYTKQINAVVDIITEALADCNSTVRVSGTDIDIGTAEKRFSRLTDNHILCVLEKLNAVIRDSTQKPRNLRAYILTMLYNAPDEFDKDHLEAFSKPVTDEECRFDLSEYKQLVNRFDFIPIDNDPEGGVAYEGLKDR